MPRPHPFMVRGLGAMVHDLAAVFRREPSRARVDPA